MKIRKELWFGFSLMAMILVTIIIFTPWSNLTNGHLGLIMLALIVVAIMLGFPTAFTLMGLGMFFAWIAYRSSDPALANQQVLDLMVQRAYGVMSNDVLIAVPLFVFMGYLVERASLIDKLFKSLHLATARLPGSLAVATIVTCAIFATATGIVGAVVTLMGLLAFPAMLRSGYNIQVSAGAVTAGGCLGILIPPSVLLIVYGATAGVSVVQLYAGAFFPGLMLASLYIAYVMLLAKWKPHLMPPLSEADRAVALPQYTRSLIQGGRNALAGYWRGLRSGKAEASAQRGTIAGQLLVALLPALFVLSLLGTIYYAVTVPVAAVDTSGMGFDDGAAALGNEVPPGSEFSNPELAEPGGAGDPAPAQANVNDLPLPPSDSALSNDLPLPPGADAGEVKDSTELAKSEAGSVGKLEPAPAAPVVQPAAPAQAEGEWRSAPDWFWIMAGVCVVLLGFLYSLWTWARHEIFKMLLTSFFPLAVLILAVLGSIVFGLATPTEAAAVGAFGGFFLAAAYRFIAQLGQRGGSDPGGATLATLRELGRIARESSFLTAKTSAMVCWLFVGSAIFSAAFALLGGQELVEKWVLSMDLTPLQFMLLAQAIIFILGWPLEWTEIIVIFMPIFIPLLPHFNIDPLFFGLLVALNLQTAFLSPPVAMAAFYLKGVAPKHVTLNQIFAGMMPFMGIQVIALILLYVFPQIGLWLPHAVYGR